MTKQKKQKLAKTIARARHKKAIKWHVFLHPAEILDSWASDDYINSYKNNQPRFKAEKWLDFIAYKTT